MLLRFWAPCTRFFLSIVGPTLSSQLCIGAIFAMLTNVFACQLRKDGICIWVVTIRYYHRAYELLIAQRQLLSQIYARWFFRLVLMSLTWHLEASNDANSHGLTPWPNVHPAIFWFVVKWWTVGGIQRGECSCWCTLLSLIADRHLGNSRASSSSSSPPHYVGLMDLV